MVQERLLCQAVMLLFGGFGVNSINSYGAFFYATHFALPRNRTFSPLFSLLHPFATTCLTSEVTQPLLPSHLLLPLTTSHMA